MALQWPSVSYEQWRETCDTLHAHTQVLGKLAVALAPPEPQLQHAALRLTARGWETAPLPAPDGSGALVVALDLRTHEAVVEHSDGRVAARRAHPRPRGRRGHPRGARARFAALAGAVEIDPTPQEVAWSVPLDEDSEHARYDPDQVAAYFAAATQAALVLGGVPRPLPRTLDAGQRVVGLVRPRRQPVLRPAGRSAVAGLHHAQRDGRAGGRRRLVARRRALRQGGVLCLRPPGPRGLRRRHALARGCALGRGARRVHPRLGRRPRAAPTRTPSGSSSPARRSAMPARSASGIRRCSPAPKDSHRRSSDTQRGKPCPSRAPAGASACDDVSQHVVDRLQRVGAEHHTGR